MFGSTFTERLSAAPVLLPVIRQLVANGRYYWLLTLHPKCPAELFAAYRGLAGPHAEFIEPEDLVRAEAQADVLVADTSSIVSEFTAQRKPVVTFRNRMPRPHMIDIHDPAELAAALERALQPDAAYLAEIERYAGQIHPYHDGRSSQRVLDAVDRSHPSLAGLRARRPYNLWRKLQVRRQLGYWGPARG
jgi:CDP-glycerol glycerophosphotransferase (TagB/SpsB family)